MRYILNSAVLTAFGEYTYSPLSVDEARVWLAAGETISTIRYAETAAALSALVGLEIQVDWRTIKMQPGDEALVFRLVLPPGSPRLDPADKGRLTPEFVAANSEMGLLRRVR